MELQPNLAAGAVLKLGALAYLVHVLRLICKSDVVGSIGNNVHDAGSSAIL